PCISSWNASRCPARPRLAALAMARVTSAFAIVVVGARTAAAFLAVVRFFVVVRFVGLFLVVFFVGVFLVVFFVGVFLAGVMTAVPAARASASPARRGPNPLAPHGASSATARPTSPR